MSDKSLTRCEFCERVMKYGEEYICQYCKGIFCIEHRLPPKHNCPMIALWNAKPPPKARLSTSKSEKLIEKLRRARRRK